VANIAPVQFPGEARGHQYLMDHGYLLQIHDALHKHALTVHDNSKDAAALQ